MYIYIYIYIYIVSYHVMSYHILYIYIIYKYVRIGKGWIRTAKKWAQKQNLSPAIGIYHGLTATMGINMSQVYSFTFPGTAPK